MNKFFSRIQYQKSTPMHVPTMYKDIAPAYIEVGSGSFQVCNKEEDEMM